MTGPLLYRLPCGVNLTRRTALRAEPGFAKFVKSLETAPTSGLGKDAEYALWINSYNVLAIKMVADNPCKKSMLGLKKSKISSIKGKPKKRGWQDISTDVRHAHVLRYSECKRRQI